MSKFICVTPSQRNPLYLDENSIRTVLLYADGSATITMAGNDGFPVRDGAGVMNLRRMLSGSQPIPHQFLELMRSVEGVLAEFGATEPGAVEKRGDVEAPASMLLDQLYIAWNNCMRELHDEPDAACVPVPVSGEEERS